MADYKSVRKSRNFTMLPNKIFNGPRWIQNSSEIVLQKVQIIMRVAHPVLLPFMYPLFETDLINLK